MKNTITKTLFLAAALLAFASSHAERGDAKKQIKVDYGTINIDDVQQVTLLEKGVTISRGTLRMEADHATLKTSPDDYQYATMFGSAAKVATFRQKSDAGPNTWIEGQAVRIEYDEKTGQVKLFDNARLRKLDGSKLLQEMQSDFITYDSRKERFEARNDSVKDGRGTLIIEPVEKAK